MIKQTKARVTLSVNAQKTLFQDVHRRRHIEACGILIGRIDEQGNWHVEQTQPLRNIFDSPVYFEFAPEELLTVELAYPEQIIGVYHSHPTGFAKASGTDRENMQRVNVEQEIPWVWLIIRGPFHDVPSPKDEERIACSYVLAYHHYVQEGLQRIAVELEQETEEPSQNGLESSQSSTHTL
jgi:proteasome lid subunit RPN8/RPN11